MPMLALMKVEIIIIKFIFYFVRYLFFKSLLNVFINQLSFSRNQWQRMGIANSSDIKILFLFLKLFLSLNMKQYGCVCVLKTRVDDSV